MADAEDKPNRGRSLGDWKFILAIILIIAYSGAAAYAIASDNSVRGLTVKMFSISRYCTPSQPNSPDTLDYNVQGSIWSASSVQTSLSHLSFTLSVDGTVLGTNTQSPTSFGPGRSVPFNLVFSHPTLNPTMLPTSSKIVVTLTATVAAGFYSADEAASDNAIQVFSGTEC